MIRHPQDPEHLWLCPWNPVLRQYSLVFTEKLSGDTFRQCLDREIAWLLPLERRRDYLISSMARAHLETELLVEKGTHASFIVEIFVVDLYGQRALQAVNDADDLNWLTATDLVRGRTESDLPVDPVQVQLLQKASVFHPRYHPGSQKRGGN